MHCNGDPRVTHRLKSKDRFVLEEEKKSSKRIHSQPALAMISFTLQVNSNRTQPSFPCTLDILTPLEGPLSGQGICDGDINLMASFIYVSESSCCNIKTLPNDSDIDVAINCRLTVLKYVDEKKQNSENGSHWSCSSPLVLGAQPRSFQVK